MTDDETAGTRDGLSHASLYDVRVNDPKQQLVDRSASSEKDLAEITELMNALGALREAELQLSRASRRYMKLNETDMRALHYLILCRNKKVIATPGGIAQFLDISTASTTKLLDRLEASGHIVREPHPSDRRALAISITPETHRAAAQTVGKQQSQRFYAAQKLSSKERQIVTAFLRDMTERISLADADWASEKN